MKGFALGLALKQRRKATRKSPISSPGPSALPDGASHELPGASHAEGPGDEVVVGVHHTRKENPVT